MITQSLKNKMNFQERKKNDKDKKSGNKDI